MMLVSAEFSLTTGSFGALSHGEPLSLFFITSKPISSKGEHQFIYKTLSLFV